MNPENFTRALNLFDQFIVEHGSAKVQKPHLDFLKDVVSALRDENKTLKDRVKDLEKDLEIARETMTQLHAHNKALKDAGKKPEVALDDLERGLLIWLASNEDGLTDDTLAESAKGLNRQRLIYHLERLVDAGFLDRSIDAEYDWFNRITKEGRRFLVENALI